MRFIFAILLTFCYVYPPNFLFLPVPFRWVYSIIGVLYLIHDYRKITVTHEQWHKWRRLVLICVLLLLVSCISSVINNVFDAYFYKVPIQIFLSFTAAYGYIVLVRKICKIELTGTNLMQLFVYAVFFQCIIAIVFFIFPGVQEAANGLLRMSGLQEDAIDRNSFSRVRLIGFASGFFVGGTKNAICLFFIAVLLMGKEISNKVFNIIALFVVFVVGCGMARTTMVGIIAFAAYFLVNGKVSIIKKVWLTSIVTAIVVISFSIVINHLAKSSYWGDIIFRGFQVYYEYTESGSSEHLNMYSDTDIYPRKDETKTWIIGDARMADPLDPEMAYYKGVDFGYARTIFCIGLTGLFVYLLIQFYLCRMMAPMFGWIELLFFFGLFLSFMVKGIYSMDTTIAPFVMVGVYNSVQNKYKAVKKSFY